MVMSNWTSLGTTGNFAAGPSVGKNADGRLEAFIWKSGVDGVVELMHIRQHAPSGGGGWDGWSSLGSSSYGLVFESSPAIAANDDGRQEVFTTSFNGELVHIWQLATGGWSSWTSLTSPANVALSPLIGVHVNDDGRLEVFVTVTSRSGAGEGSVAGALWHIWQNTPNGKWSNWASLGSPSNSVSIFGTPFVAENDDGRLEAFILASDGALWHTWQVSPGGT